MLAIDLIETARGLVNLNQVNPIQSNLSRAQSTAYYALFHALCLNCADTWVGSTKSDRNQPAWLQVYRAPKHNIVKNKCKSKEMSRFPRGIQDFAIKFVELQEKRHQADYNPLFNITSEYVLNDINNAEGAIRNLQESDLSAKTAFAVWVTMSNRTS